MESGPDVAVAVGALLNLLLAVLFGLPLFVLYGVEQGSRAILACPLRRLCVTVGLSALLLTAAELLLLAAGMAGIAVAALDRPTVAAVLALPVGAALLARAAALAGIIAIAAASRLTTTVPRAVVALLAAVALATIAWGGHLAAGEGAAGWLRLGSGVVHLWGAGAWVGALAGFLLLVRRAGRAGTDDLHDALAAFARTGTLAVAAIAATGLASTWSIAGVSSLAALAALADSLWGRVLIAKLALFGAMLSLAALNRFRLTPALASADDAGHKVTALRRSIAAEATLGALVLALAAWLCTLSPRA